MVGDGVDSSVHCCRNQASEWVLGGRGEGPNVRAVQQFSLFAVPLLALARACLSLSLGLTRDLVQCAVHACRR